MSNRSDQGGRASRLVRTQRQVTVIAVRKLHNLFSNGRQYSFQVVKLQEQFFKRFKRNRCNLYYCIPVIELQPSRPRSGHCKESGQGMDTSSGQLPQVRIDKWLWAARFFKTRSMAAKAVNGGKVHLNDARVKPARTVQEGDKLVVSKGPYEFRIEVLAVSGQRRPAKEARLLYEESEESIRERERQRDLRRMMNAGHTAPTAKPDKRDRRKIKAFIRKD